MEYLVSLLVTLFVILVVGGLIYWGGHKLAAAFGIPEPIITIFDVLIVIVLVLLLLGLLVGSVHPLRLPT